MKLWCGWHYGFNFNTSTIGLPVLQWLGPVITPLITPGAITSNRSGGPGRAATSHNENDDDGDEDALHSAHAVPGGEMKAA